MELDDIKNILQQDIPTEKLSEASFKKVKKWKSLHPAEKVKRKVFYELILGTIISVLYIIFLIKNRFEIAQFSFWFIIIIIAILLTYSITSYLKLRTLLKYGDDTKSFLKKFNKTIKRYIRTFCLLTVIIIVPLSIVGFIEGFAAGAKIDQTEVFSAFLDKPVIFVILFFLITISGSTGYGIAYLIYRLIYNKQIKQIDELIREIE